jgi:flagellar protein FlaF
MYHSSYIAAAEDDCAVARATEWRALDQAVSLLEAARPTGSASRETTEAIAFVGRLWTLLIEDLANSDNALPEALRASLISIGLFALKQGELLRLGQSEDFDSIIDVNRMIRDGLA